MLNTAFIITSSHSDETSSIQKLETTLKSCSRFAQQKQAKILNFILNYGPAKYPKETTEPLLPQIAAIIEYADNPNIQTLYQMAPDHQLTSLAKTLTLNWFLFHCLGQNILRKVGRFIIIQEGEIIDELLMQSRLFSLEKQEQSLIFLPAKQISNLSAQESKQVFFKRHPKAWGFDSPTIKMVLKMLSDMASHMQSSFDQVHCLDFEHALFSHTPDEKYITEEKQLQK